MSTALDTDTAADGEVIALVWTYLGSSGSSANPVGVASVAEFFGLVSPADVMQQIKLAIQNTGALLPGKSGYAESSGLTATGQGFWVVQCLVTSSGDSVSYGSILSSVQSVAIPYGAGDVVSLIGGDYSDPSDDPVALAQQMAAGAPSLATDAGQVVGTVLAGAGQAMRDVVAGAAPALGITSWAPILWAAAALAIGYLVLEREA